MRRIVFVTGGGLFVVFVSAGGRGGAGCLLVVLAGLVIVAVVITSPLLLFGLFGGGPPRRASAAAPSGAPLVRAGRLIELPSTIAEHLVGLCSRHGLVGAVRLEPGGAELGAHAVDPAQLLGRWPDGVRANGRGQRVGLGDGFDEIDQRESGLLLLLRS